MGLDLNGQTALGSCLLQRLLRHEGVRDTGRATGGGDDVKLSHVSLLLEYSARGRSPTRASMRVFPHLKDTKSPLVREEIQLISPVKGSFITVNGR